MGKIAVKKMAYDSPEFRESDGDIVDGTPQYRWDMYWELLLAANAFTKHYADFTKPLRRDVAKIIRE